MFFVRTEGMEGLNAHDTYDPAEDIGLLEVDVNKFGCTVFRMFDRFTNVADLQFRWQRNRTVETFWIENHCARNFSRFIEQCKPFLAVGASGYTGLRTVVSASIQNGQNWNPPRSHIEKYMVVLNPNAFIPYRDRSGYG